MARVFVPALGFFFLYSLRKGQETVLDEFAHRNAIDLVYFFLSPLLTGSFHPISGHWPGHGFSLQTVWGKGGGV